MNPYFAIEVGWLRHPKVRKVHKDARSLWIAGGLHAVEHETDGVIAKHMLALIAAEAEVRSTYVNDLLNAGLWHDLGDHYEIHDFLDRNPSREQREKQRAKWRQSASLHDDKRLVAAIRARDGDECRYCGRVVDWKDRRGERGGTYDHVDPTLGNTPENVVVCCRSCNSKKGSRTPASAGMALRSSTADLPRDLQEPTGSLREKPARSSLLSFSLDQNQGQNTCAVEPDSTFEDFWSCYPRKIGKPAARASFVRALTKTTAGGITDGLSNWCTYWRAKDDMEHIPHPTTWLNQERWNDLPPAPAKPKGKADIEHLLSTTNNRRIIDTGETA